MRRLVSAAACDPASEQVVFALVGGIIHVDFHAEADLFNLRGSPGHRVFLHRFARQDFGIGFDPSALFERNTAIPTNVARLVQTIITLAGKPEPQSLNSERQIPDRAGFDNRVCLPVRSHTP